MHVEVNLFARLRELCGRRQMSLEMPDGADVEACFGRLAASHPEIEALRHRLAVAVNEEYSGWDRELADGDVVTFIPPVSGGLAEAGSPAGGVHVRVTESSISAAALRQLVAHPGAGAIATFEGTVRDHSGERATDHLEYEAYAPMTERVFRTIASAAHDRWSLLAVAIHHRVGRLEIGEVSVAIAVSAEHRADAFAACRFAIDELKRQAPIWKKEFGHDGSHWVEGPTPSPD